VGTLNPNVTATYAGGPETALLGAGGERVRGKMDGRGRHRQAWRRAAMNRGLILIHDNTVEDRAEAVVDRNMYVGDLKHRPWRCFEDPMSGEAMWW
jgi:hypothetical protein